jgi:hypothetical protein
MRLEESEGRHGVVALAAPVSEKLGAGTRCAPSRWIGELADHPATIVGVDRVNGQIVPLADKVDIRLVADAAPFSRNVFWHGDLGSGGQAVMDNERAALSDQPEALDEIAPGRLIFMPGVDERDVERAVLLADFLEAFANIEIAAPIVDGQAIAEIVGATIHQPAAGGEIRPVDLGVSPPGRNGTQLQIMTIAVHLGQMVDEVRFGPLLGNFSPPTKP